MKTAVEWLVEKLDQNFDYVADTLIEQAKEMEKEQIVDAFEADNTEYNVYSFARLRTIKD